MKNVLLVLLALGSVCQTLDAVAQDTKRGADAYKLCAGCHGFKAEGNELINAPALAGQEDWYLERQLENFRDGIRGSVSDDVHGQRMAQTMMAVDGDREIADIVAYIGTLSRISPASTLGGDTDAGRALYTPCAACHGANGEGNVTLNAPALATMQDWYQLAQLKKFADGTRGRAPGDVYGMQMAPMVATLTDEQAMRDVIAYVTSLQ